MATDEVNKELSELNNMAESKCKQPHFHLQLAEGFLLATNATGEGLSVKDVMIIPYQWVL